MRLGFSVTQDWGKRLRICGLWVLESSLVPRLRTGPAILKKTGIRTGQGSTPEPRQISELTPWWQKRTARAGGGIAAGCLDLFLSVTGLPMLLPAQQ